MPIPILAQLAIGVLGLFVAYALTPKPKQEPPPSVEDLKEPTATVNRPRIVLFGSMRIDSPNIMSVSDKDIAYREASIEKK